MVFHGYTDPALTEEAFDEDGYFRTGDLGRLRADGHLTLTGRLKDVIVRKGENISAKEIEDLLYTHPKVVEVAVIGLPDPERGERVCAVVQLADGAGGLELAEVVGFCRDAGLMTQKIPEQLEIRDRVAPGRNGQDRQEVAARRVLGGVTAARPGPLVPPGPIGGRPYRIVFVCTGNICRSPMAEVITRLAGRIDRARTTARRSRTISTCAAPAPARGTRASRCTRSASAPWSGPATPATPTSPTRSRPRSSVRSTCWWRSTAATNRPCAGSGPTRTGSSSSGPSTPRRGAAADVPDPYYGDDAVFDECRDMIAAACAGLVASLALHWDSLWAA